jgi:hypothetical protein
MANDMNPFTALNELRQETYRLLRGLTKTTRMVSSVANVLFGRTPQAARNQGPRHASPGQSRQPPRGPKLHNSRSDRYAAGRQPSAEYRSSNDTSPGLPASTLANPAYRDIDPRQAVVREQKKVEALKRVEGSGLVNPKSPGQQGDAFSRVNWGDPRVGVRNREDAAVAERITERASKLDPRAADYLASGSRNDADLENLGLSTEALRSTKAAIWARDNVVFNLDSPDLTPASGAPKLGDHGL